MAERMRVTSLIAEVRRGETTGPGTRPGVVARIVSPGSPMGGMAPQDILPGLGPGGDAGWTWPEGSIRPLRNDQSTRLAITEEQISICRIEGSRIRSALSACRPDRKVGFEVVAVGTRRGGTQYNGRGNDLAPAPFGAVLSLAAESRAERVAPEHFHGYGWR